VGVLKSSRFVELLALIFGQDGLQFLDHFRDVFFGHLTGFEGEVLGDLLLRVVEHGDVGFFGDLVLRRTLRVVDAQNHFLDFFLLSHFLQLLRHLVFVVGQEDDKRAQLAIRVLGGSRFKLLDQTGQARGDFACEDRSDRVRAIASNLATLLASIRPVDIQRVEGSN
jgi:hypothetical protein